MTELTNITQQPEVEFVNREFAEAEAKRAITLLNASDESKVEAWFALQAVADQVGPASNVGVKGVSWGPSAPSRHGARYQIVVRCADGFVNTQTGAPPTLAEARETEHLDKVRRMVDRLVEENGGPAHPGRRPQGTGRALMAAIAASPEGQAWLAQSTNEEGTRDALTRIVKVADAYGRDGVYPSASVHAHKAFLTFDNRAELIRQYPSTTSAHAKAMALRRCADAPPASISPRINPSPSKVTRIAIRSGASMHFARAALREYMEGRSKAQLIRAVNEAIKMVGEQDAPKLRAA